MQLRDKLDQDRMLITAWSTSPSEEMAGALARCPFDTVTVDMQHGAHTETTALTPPRRRSCAAGKPAIMAHTAWGGTIWPVRALDMGFEAVIAPMINSVSDAEAFAAAMKYPPVGERPWGRDSAAAAFGAFARELFQVGQQRDPCAGNDRNPRRIRSALTGFLQPTGSKESLSDLRIFRSRGRTGRVSIRKTKSFRT